MPPNKFKIYSVIAVAVLAVSTAAIWVRLAMETANDQSIGFSLFLAASRLLVSSAILLPNAGKLRSQSLNSKSLCYAAIAGICLAGHFACWISSLALTSIVASATLVTTNPIWVALLSWIFWREKLTKPTLWGIAIATTGGIIIAVGSADDLGFGRNPLMGSLLALAGAVFASLYILIGRQAQKDMSTTSYVTVAYTTAAIALLPLPLLWQVPYSSHEPLVYGYVMLMAMICQLIGHTSYNWSLRWISPAFVALTILLEPIISGILGVLIFQEVPSTTLLLGGVIVLVGVATAIYQDTD